MRLSKAERDSVVAATVRAWRRKPPTGKSWEFTMAGDRYAEFAMLFEHAFFEGYMHARKTRRRIK